MKSDFVSAIAQIASEKGLDQEDVINALETAILSAYRKVSGDPVPNAVAYFDAQSGESKIYVPKLVVEEVSDTEAEISLADAQAIDSEAETGDEIEVEITPPNVGRIAAQAARQVLLQSLREKERDHVYDDFIDRVGEIVSGRVQRVDSRGVVLDFGRAEALMSSADMVPGERDRYRLGQRLRAYIAEVRKDLKGPVVRVSRAHKDFIRRLIEQEVPEVQTGTVEIKEIARDPGSRTKVAVAAKQEGLDPVGSCVGMRGTRIQNVLRELGNEKVEIIEWSDDTATFIKNALSPAEIQRVELIEVDEQQVASVHVDADMVSLAIGRDGQNTRLANRLTGWKINIRSLEDEQDDADVPPADTADASAGAEDAAAQEPAEQQAAAESLTAEESTSSTG
ncbi:MAG: transcription termination factor NusA [Chloroflexota bacterium]|nr:transcription termination factor NusA [Chloroflexota bacterium]MDE2839763.1 transcription termination factor NusA [Chloroflexota bacterium]MDE2931355.1 transcription termination factor NusA [Chloroflexota bacterium]